MRDAYEIRIYSTDGEELEHFVREAPWFPPHMSTGSAVAVTPGPTASRTGPRRTGASHPRSSLGRPFTYRLSLMRPGTFMYHTHKNDLEQLSGGLYGPLIVLPPGETFDPEHDHPRIVAWRNAGVPQPGAH